MCVRPEVVTCPELEVGLSASTYPAILAGLPTTIAFGGTERVTTAPAPIMAFRPIVKPGRMVAFAPMEAEASTMTGIGGRMVQVVRSAVTCW